MKRNGYILWSLILTLLLLSACGEKQPAHTHAWEPATCTRGEFCFGCGETKGDALSHNWVDATCQDAKHCSLCNIIEGNRLDHTPGSGDHCAACGGELPRNVILNHNESNRNYTVYGGVRLGMCKDLPNGLPADYIIYDQDGTVVTQGKWGQLTLLDKFPGTLYEEGKPFYTDFIPLKPGTYTVTYTYYRENGFPTNDKGQISGPCLPHGEASTGTCSLTVK